MRGRRLREGERAEIIETADAEEGAVGAVHVLGAVAWSGVMKEGQHGAPIREARARNAG